MSSISYFFFIALGYLSGSIYYSQLLPAVVRHVDITRASDDGNPGSGNVFKCIGPSLGVPCLICDLLKGTVPVALCLHLLGWDHPLFGLVIAAPVFGHAKKGKAIAVSFGVFLGLLPFSAMVFYLVYPFIFFSAFVRVNPHSWRVIFSFLCFLSAALFRVDIPALQFGGLLVAAAVIGKHLPIGRDCSVRPRLNLGWDFSVLKRRR